MNQKLLIATVEDAKDADSTAWVRFTPFNPNPTHSERIYSVQQLFVSMKNALKESTGNLTWSLRYASRVTKENLPFLHSSKTLQVILDPLLPYRDPVRELMTLGYLEFQISDSQAYYFKSMQDANTITEAERAAKAEADDKQ